MPTIKMDPAIMKEMDAPLVEVAQRSGGDLRKLMYCFFSFLHRRTDFYCVPHEDDANNSRLGFQEGDAEKLLLAAFRQFPLRKMPKQNKPSPPADPPGQSTPATTATPRQTTTTTNDSSSKKESEKAEKTPSKPKVPTEIAIRKAAHEDPLESTRFTDEGRQVPVGNGGATSEFRWTQTLEEVTVIVAPPTGTRGKDMNVTLKSNFVGVKMKKPLEGEPGPRIILDSKDLSNKIQASESTWSLEGGVMLVVLQKAKKSWWECVFEGDPKIDTTLVDSRRRIDEYDDSTQGAIRRILFDQRQERLGLPKSEQILRQQGKNPIPKLPDGVEFIDNDVLEKADASRLSEA